MVFVGQGQGSGRRSAGESTPHQQMILPTFTRPDIHFNPYIPS